ncbi:uncharacterized protein [Euphorbia lathyris]|uniref:uncharacterized protein n=1 Tax=Euphorbia lathyris TaxID=212925 RepID=UPI0033143591
MSYEDGRVSKEEFKAISDKAKISKSYDEHPRYMGQSSYAQKEVIWCNKGLYSSSSPLGGESKRVMNSLSIKGRNWILARSKIDEEGNLIVPNEKTQKVKVKIDHWEPLRIDREFVPCSTDDVLNRSLEKPEPGGRVRGIGGKAVIRTAFGSYSRGGITQAQFKDFMAAMEKMKQLQAEEIRAQIRLVLSEMGIQIPSQVVAPVDPRPVDVAFPTLGKRNCHSGGVDPFADIQGTTPCRLALLIKSAKVSITQAQFRGLVAAMERSKQFQAEEIRKQVKLLLSEMGMQIPSQADVPVDSRPVDAAFSTLGKSSCHSGGVDPFADIQANSMKGRTNKRKQSESGHATNESVVQLKKPIDPHEATLPKLSKKCKFMQSMLDDYTDNHMFEVPVDKDVFGHSEDMTIYIGVEDVTHLLTGKWLSTSVLEVFMIALKSLYSRYLDSIGFLCPNLVLSTMLQTKNLKDESLKYLVDTIIRYKAKRFIFFPYNEGNHWILLVICMENCAVYSFDPKVPSKFGHNIIKSHLNRVFLAYQQLEPKRGG